MDINLKKRSPGDIEFGFIYGTIALLALAAARFLPLADMMPSCVFMAFTGMPCPACGVTRSLVHLAQGDLEGSLRLNPAVTLALITVLLLFLYDAASRFSGSRISLSLTSREAQLFRAGTVAVFMANWIYLAFSL